MREKQRGLKADSDRFNPVTPPPQLSTRTSPCTKGKRVTGPYFTARPLARSLFRARNEEVSNRVASEDGEAKSANPIYCMARRGLFSPTFYLSGSDLQ